MPATSFYGTLHLAQGSLPQVWVRSLGTVVRPSKDLTLQCWLCCFSES